MSVGATRRLDQYFPIYQYLVVEICLTPIDRRTIFPKGTYSKTAKKFAEPSELPACHVPYCWEAADHAPFNLGFRVLIREGERTGRDDH